MRRTILVFAVASLAAAMFIPATAAAPSKVPATVLKPVAGTWTWVNTAFNVWKTTKKGVQYASGSEDGTWTGDFEGTSVDDFGVQIWPDGTVWALLTISFDGTVKDKTGTLQILTTAVVRDPDKPMTGTWTIASGTGDLVNFGGQGTWYYDADLEGAYYSGIIKEFVPSTP
jgi:hypothetical protein